MMLLLFLVTCTNRPQSSYWETERFPSIEYSMIAEGLPLMINFPISDDTLGDFKIQVSSQLDGFVWQIKKGNDFQFQIEDIGMDAHIFDDKVHEILQMDLVKNNLLLQNDSMLVYRRKNIKTSVSYCIFRKVEINNASNKSYYIAMTDITGVPAENYHKMLQTLSSIRGVKVSNK